jgi:hypothetical protein
MYVIAVISNIDMKILWVAQLSQKESNQDVVLHKWSSH